MYEMNLSSFVQKKKNQNKTHDGTDRTTAKSDNEKTRNAASYRI